MRISLRRGAIRWCLVTAALCGATLCGAGAVRADTAAATSFVRFTTPLGNVDVELLTQQTPKTVANFLSYVDSGAYGSTFIERSVPGFVLQGGGYDVTPANRSNPISPVAAAAPVQGEPGVSNTRGTLAMALPSNANGSTNTNGGTDEWFFNLADNTSLDAQGFTVFGVVVGAQSLAVLDAISRLSTATFSNVDGGAFPTPILKGTAPDPAQLVTTHISRLDDTTAPTITISSPVEHAQIAEGAKVVPQFSCDDGSGVGVASCTVTQPLDTTMVGLDQLTVTATDFAGNTSTKSVDVTVLGPSTGTAAPKKPAAVVPAVALGVATAAGSLPVTVRCPAGAHAACAGTVALTAVSRGRRIGLGSTRYRVARGKRAVSALRLNRSALALLRANHMRLRVTVSVTPAGDKPHSRTARLTQRAKH